MTDAINKPAHYTYGSIETIDVIESWGLGFHLGNAVKYISRAGRKGDKSTDLRKAQWYLARELERIQPRDDGEVRVGDRLRCVVASPCGKLEQGVEYIAAKVSNGDRMAFVCIEGHPARYWDVARFEVVS